MGSYRVILRENVSVQLDVFDRNKIWFCYKMYQLKEKKAIVMLLWISLSGKYLVKVTA